MWYAGSSGSGRTSTKPSSTNTLMPSTRSSAWSRWLSSRTRITRPLASQGQNSVAVTYPDAGMGAQPPGDKDAEGLVRREHLACVIDERDALPGGAEHAAHIGAHGAADQRRLLGHGAVVRSLTQPGVERDGGDAQLVEDAR